MTDLYKVLGVTPRATKAEIKSAYRKLAREFHPDVSSSPDANARFVQIGEAYRILSNPSLRSRYDKGEPVSVRQTFYANAAEVIAYQRELDRFVDEMIDQERQETAARTHAVSVVVTLFLSSFYVAFAKPAILDDLNILGKVLVIGVSIYGLWYLIKNLAIVLARYTYIEPDTVTSILKEEEVTDKLVSRTAGLFFIVSGYIVSLGLGYFLSMITNLYYSKSLGTSTILGIFLYPPIAVMIISSFRKVGSFFDR